MPLSKSKIFYNKPSRSVQSGEELLRLWLELGTMRLAVLEYNRRHEGEDFIRFSGSAARRMRFWLVRDTDKAMEVIREFEGWSEEAIQEKMVFYAVREYRDYREFLKWADEHPWAKRFEADYKTWYGI